MNNKNYDNNNSHNNKLSTTEHPNLIEFRKKAQFDGEIIINKNIIVKKKPKHLLTIDLLYDAEGGVFLDSDKNIYLMKNYKDMASTEILNLIDDNNNNDFVNSLKKKPPPNIINDQDNTAKIKPHKKRGRKRKIICDEFINYN